jgi:Xaa-Pro aminopeptidase
VAGFDYADRLGRLGDSMRARSVDVLMLSVGADLPYFTGYEAMPLERLTMLVVRPDERTVLFVPELERPRVASGPFDIVAWGETDDPIALVVERSSGAAMVAIGDHTWSTFLLALQDRLSSDVKWIRASELTSELRLRKESTEIELLRAAAEGVDRVLARLPTEVRFIGRTEREIAGDLNRMTVEEGHDSASFAIVASGPNGSSPHHEPTDRVLEEGDLVVCDFGGRVDGYYSDVSRTFVLGSPSSRQIEIHSVVLAANEAARSAVGPGVTCEDVDRAARRVVEDAGYGKQFIHRTGHGIGLEPHEHPYIVEGNRRRLESGMAFSIEPGIYIPGQMGVRIEDIVTCSPDGIDELNQVDRGLVEVY